MAHPIITLLPWVPPLVPHIIPPRYITEDVTMLDTNLKYQNDEQVFRDDLEICL